MAATGKGSMARVLPVAVLLAAAHAGTVRADSGPHPEFVDNDFIGEQGVRATFAPEDFTIGFDVNIPSSGGTVQPVSLGTNPVLGALTTGFQHAIYTFAPCGVVFPHVHPRGDENVFVLEGTIDAGFVDEAGTLIRDQAIATNSAFVIPQGYVHYVANPTCEPAAALVTLPSADGGIYGAVTAVLSLPPNILRASVPSVTEEALLQLQAAAITSGAISVDPACEARCSGGMGSNGQ
eukprot:jgi/Ulvmu1/2119/UM127_0004.1